VEVHRLESMSMSIGESAWIADVLDCRGRKEAGWLHALAAELQEYISGNTFACCAHRLTRDAGMRGCGDARLHTETVSVSVSVYREKGWKGEETYRRGCMYVHVYVCAHVCVCLVHGALDGTRCLAVTYIHAPVHLYVHACIHTYIHAYIQNLYITKMVLSMYLTHMVL
jgi:hypothetical protein